MNYRCYLCQDWGWLTVGDGFVECPNGEEEGWSSNDERFDATPQFTHTFTTERPR